LFAKKIKASKNCFVESVFCVSIILSVKANTFLKTKNHGRFLNNKFIDTIKGLSKNRNFYKF